MKPLFHRDNSDNLKSTHDSHARFVSTRVTRCLAALLLLASACSRPAATFADTHLNSDEVTESSGLARSTLNDEILWTHNDSGDSPRLFAFTRSGDLRAIVRVRGIEALDWEDMCAFEHEGKHYLAIGDMGDNSFGRPYISFFIIEEPELTEPEKKNDKKDKKDKKKSHDKDEKKGKDKPIELKVDTVAEIRVQYPQGAMNCEAIAFDPLRKEFVLATKDRFLSVIFTFPLTLESNRKPIQAERQCSLNLPLVTGATISDDGEQMLLATYGPGCLIRRSLLKKAPNSQAQATDQTTSPAAQWAVTQPEQIEYVELPQRSQGEAICFEADGKHVLLTSEGKPMPLFVMTLPASAKP